MLFGFLEPVHAALVNHLRVTLSPEAMPELFAAYQTLAGELHDQDPRLSNSQRLKRQQDHEQDDAA